MCPGSYRKVLQRPGGAHKPTRLPRTERHEGWRSPVDHPGLRFSLRETRNCCPRMAPALTALCCCGDPSASLPVPSHARSRSLGLRVAQPCHMPLAGRPAPLPTKPLGILFSCVSLAPHPCSLLFYHSAAQAFHFQVGGLSSSPAPLTHAISATLPCSRAGTWLPINAPAQEDVLAAV